MKLADFIKDDLNMELNTMNAKEKNQKAHLKAYC